MNDTITRFDDAIESNVESPSYPGDVIPQIVETNNPPNYRCLDGIPREAHKTTQCVHEAAENDDEHKLLLALNHTLCEENIKDKLTEGEHSIGATTAVHVKGKDRACGGCDMCVDGPQQEDYGKIKNAIDDALIKYDYIRPEVFTEVCPYIACKMAIEEVEWISTVPEMWPHIQNYVSNDRSVIVDEESTMPYFLPNSGPILKCHVFEGENQRFSPKEHTLSDNGIEYLETRIQNKLDEMDRPRSRHTNIEKGLHALRHVYDQLQEFKQKVLPYCHEIEELQAAVDTYINIPNPELDGTVGEHHATFNELRTKYTRSDTADLVEAIFFDARIKVMPSQGQVTFNFIPDPFAGFMINRDLFSEANNVWFVGNHYASYVAGHFHPDPYDQVVNLSEDHDLTKDQLEIVKVDAENDEEMRRRGAMTRIAKDLTIDYGHHNLLIAGSGQRAYNACESIGRKSHFFNGADDLEEYEEVRSIDWNVTSYLGSRLTRGVDVDTNVTIVRSDKFATPQWDYYDEGDTLDDVDLKPVMNEMREYENQIEAHNAMLRGAGQGEKHIAVIPSDVSLLWELDELAVGYDYLNITDILEHILDAIGKIDVRGAMEYACIWCESVFMTLKQALPTVHECEDYEDSAAG